VRAEKRERERERETKGQEEGCKTVYYARVHELNGVSDLVEVVST